MFELTAKQTQRAEALHRDSLIVDTLNSGPGVDTPELLASLQAWVDEDLPVTEIMGRLADQRHELICAGRLEGYREAWGQSGVDVVSNTFGASGAQIWSRESAIQDIARQLELFASVDWLEPVRSADDIERIHVEGKHGVIINFQNATHIENDLNNLTLFHRLGLRIMQMTYNDRNLLGDGCTEINQGGLSNFGHKVVKRMNELGIAVDMSHSGHATTLDAVKASERPVILSHAFAHALHHHARGKEDEVLDAVAANGGYFGIVLVPFFLTKEPEATLVHFLEHVEYIVSRIGSEHVGIGSDWGEDTPAPLLAKLEEFTQQLNFRPEDRVDWQARTKGFETFECWPNITRALVHAGYDDDQIRGMLGENFLRVFRAATE